MALSCSIELLQDESCQLLEIARESIRNGLTQANSLQVCLEDLPPSLVASAGAFVTLTRDNKLRGCIGTLQAIEPLAQTVSDSAYGAAFTDPRFAQLQSHELAPTRIEISILSAMTHVAVITRAQLLAELEPGIDGLLIEDGKHRSTFLPKVWEQLPKPSEFLGQLLIKAGLPQDYWSPSIRCYRYRTTCLCDS